ncbi:hypothetical protein PBY51_009231 [Eleginops maclovinus]|uniref:G-protein coupled receptors family 1 profile domain-containing protein n=1 Tax=Eleginops maclovinus TaxID=56733 RepID=A0AAN7XY63_ELEMC|nr:hypothetical protein PBY51_009231 [Eleginops maclovinus]
MDHLNTSNLPNNQSDFDRVSTLKVLLPPLYLLTWLVGGALNGVAACIFFRVPSDSGLVVYLKNMVVADLLMLTSFPFKAAADLGVGGWRMHVVTCRYTGVLFYSCMYVGIVFMGFISLERYMKIVRHNSSNTSTCWSRWCSVSRLHLLQSPGFARALALLTWMSLLLSVLPNVLLTSNPANETNAHQCMQLKTPFGLQWHKYSTYFNIGLFWLALCLLSFCYTSIACRLYSSYRLIRRGQSNACRKSKRSIFSILVVFFVCFVPYHVLRVPYTLSQGKGSGFINDDRFLLFQLKEATLFLSAFNVCLDPVIYFLMCRTFRESLLRKLSGRRGRGRGRGRSRRGSLTTGQSFTNLGGGEEVRERGKDTRIGD